METTTNGNTTKRKGGKRKLSKEELRAMLPEKLNKLGEWWFSDDREKWEITDMRAVLK